LFQEVATSDFDLRVLNAVVWVNPAPAYIIIKERRNFRVKPKRL
jgi:hypothetical protein